MTCQVLASSCSPYAGGFFHAGGGCAAGCRTRACFCRAAAPQGAGAGARSRAGGGAASGAGARTGAASAYDKKGGMVEWMQNICESGAPSACLLPLVESGL